MKKNNETVEYVFLPGVPGRKKDFLFMTDLRIKGLTVHEYRHPGLYEEIGEFSITNTIKNIELLLKNLENSEKPFVIIAYSFSSLIIQKIDLFKYKYLKGISLFSPVFGLGSDWIHEDFLDSIKFLKSEGNCKPAESMEFELENLMKPKYCFDGLDVLVKTGLPISLFYSKNDSALDIPKLSKSIQEYKDLYGQGVIFSIEMNEGDHRIDTYYSNPIKNVLLSFIARERVISLLGNDTYMFIWGSSQITHFFNNGCSDIDLYVLSDGYLAHFSELSDLQLKFKEQFDTKLDLSINNLSDLLSEKISRFNRGPILAHGVNQHFFSIDKKKIKIDVNIQEVKYDCYMASLINYRECEKKISRLNNSDEQMRRFAKLFSISVFYLLHIRNINNIDMNDLDRWLDKSKDKEIIKALELSRKILNGGQEKIIDQEWLVILNTMEIILKEEEKILNINYGQYGLDLSDKVFRIGTPEKSKVVLSNVTRKILKMYFSDSKEQVRDIKRINTHASQLFELSKIGVNVPKNIKLIEDGTAILMDQVEGEVLDNIIKSYNPETISMVSETLDVLKNTHHLLTNIPIDFNLLIETDDLNYHCARNFKLLSLPNYLGLSNTDEVNKLKEIINKLNSILEEKPELLNKCDIIFGDFKPENIIYSKLENKFTLLDPMLALGKHSCDIGKFLSRIILVNSNILNKELDFIIKKVEKIYNKEVAKESIIMAIFDMLNLYSKIINNLEKSSKESKIEEIATLLNKNISVLLNNVYD